MIGLRGPLVGAKGCCRRCGGHGVQGVQRLCGKCYSNFSKGQWSRTLEAARLEGWLRDGNDKE